MTQKKTTVSIAELYALLAEVKDCKRQLKSAAG